MRNGGLATAASHGDQMRNGGPEIGAKNSTNSMTAEQSNRLHELFIANIQILLSASAGTATESWVTALSFREALPGLHAATATAESHSARRL